MRCWGDCGGTCDDRPVRIYALCWRCHLDLTLGRFDVREPDFWRRCGMPRWRLRLEALSHRFL